MADKRCGPLWCITAYFNPCGYARRRTNYAAFRRRVAAPLLAVELAYGPDFELGDDDADILVRLRGRDVIWQKERLLNSALRCLPAECRFVAWLDCDIIFEQDDWVAMTAEKLERFPLVQPFTCLHRLPKDVLPGQAEPAWTLPSTPAALAAGRTIDVCLNLNSEQLHLCSSMGVAWAARRELLEAHGLYDVCIVGGGDRAMICAAWGVFDNAIKGERMNERQRDCYLAWAKPYHAAVRGNVGHVPGDVYHLWHGSFKNRRVRERHAALAPFGFDPYTDLAIDSTGAWRWNSSKPALHEHVRNYFAGRKESE